MILKAEMRQLVRQRLAALCPTELAAKSAAIREKLVALDTFGNARVIALFAAQSSEPHLDPLLRWEGEAPAEPASRALPGGSAEATPSQIFCFPRVNSQGLDFYAVQTTAQLVEGRWGLREPDPTTSRLIDPEEIDLLLVPGLAFSPKGARLGRGGGFYDRLQASSTLHAHRVGVCFSEQLFEDLPLESHDREVELVISA